MPIFWGWLIALAISTGINLLLRPRIKRAKAPNLEVVRASEGIPIPLGYGTFVVAPNVVWYGNVTQTPSPVGSTYYAANMVMTLAMGAMDELVDIQYGGKSVRFEPVTSAQGGTPGAEQVIVPSLPYVRPGSADVPVTFSIQAAQMFGGREREGGIRGTMRFYWGGLNQPADPITTAYMQEAGLSGGTGRPGVCYVVFGFQGNLPFYWGTVPQIKDLTFTLRHNPRTLGVGMTGRGANPAEIIYDLKHSNLRGLGLATSISDTEVYTAVAQTLQTELLGLSPVFTTQDEAGDMIEDVLKHIFGVLRTSPRTGKFELKLARADYLANELPRVTPALRGASFANARNLRLSRSNSRETVNDITITYRRFVGGPVGPKTGVVLTTDLRYALTKTAGAYLNTGAENITLVTLYDDGIEIPATAYTFFPETGIVLIFGPLINPTAPAIGSTITIDFTAGPVFSGYKEATAHWQDLADIRKSSLRSFAADYPFITDDLVAGWVVAMLGQQMSRVLWSATWEMDRSGWHLAPADVVAINHRPLDQDGVEFEILNDTPFRTSQFDYGLLEDGTITVRAMEDVFGQDVIPVLPQPTSGTTPLLTGPSMAIGYAATSATRICLYPGDPNFAVKLYRAPTDLGQGITAGADVLDTVPGTSLYYDDTMPVAGRSSYTAGRPFTDRRMASTFYGGTQQYAGNRWSTGNRLSSRLIAPPGDTMVLDTSFWYAAQQVPTAAQRSYGPGPLTPWQQMTATAGTPGACTCSIPSVSYTTSDDGTMGTLILTLNDPQLRVLLVEFQTQAGLGPMSEWSDDTQVVAGRSPASIAGRFFSEVRSASRLYNGSLPRSAVARWATAGSASRIVAPAGLSAAPYVAMVDTTPSNPSTINYRVTYMNCAGQVVSNLTGSVSFP